MTTFLNYLNGNDPDLPSEVLAQGLSSFCYQDLLSGPHGEEFRKCLSSWHNFDRSFLNQRNRRADLGSVALSWREPDPALDSHISKLVPGYEESYKQPLSPAG